MTHNLRSRLRAVVITVICALVVAPALITGTATTAAAAPPGAATGILTVGGQANDVPPGTDTNLWRLYGDAYTSLRNELVNPANFGTAGTVTKGRYVIPATGITTINATSLANIDVFFGGVPRGNEYSPAESAALETFVLGGGGLVINANQNNFGGLPDFLTTRGLTLRDGRAFFGQYSLDCPSTGVSEHAPSPSTVAGGAAAHPTVAGPFGASGDLLNYHTVTAFTGTGTAQTLYNLNVANQVPTIAITDPVGTQTNDGINFFHVNAPITGAFTIQTAVTTPSGIASVTFYDGAVAPANQLGATDSNGADGFGVGPVNSVAVADGTRTLHAVATLVAGGTIDATLDINVDVAPLNPPPPPVAPATNPAIDPNGIDCPGGNGEVVNNNIAGPTVLTFAPGQLGPGSGPVVVTSDLDFFSSEFQAGMGQNRNFALNVFAWMMNQIIPNNVPPPPPPPETYFPLQSPIRVYDSRLTTEGAIPSGASRTIKVTGVTVGGINVPADATSIVANVTAVDSSEAGYLTVYPSGQAPPTISTHNFDQGENFANTVVMGVSNGNISVLNQFYNNGGGGTQVLVDVIGYSRSVANGSHMRTLAPVRALDSRVGTGTTKEPFHARAARELTIVGQPNVPANVQAVVLNMTVANATNTGSFITVWPSGEPQPNVSNLNIIAGVTRPNLVVARVASNGKISIVNDSGDADILADIVGYFEPTGTGGAIHTKPTPTRELDTRVTNNAFGPGETRSITIRGLPGVPSTAKTAILKITAVDPTADGGYLTVWPTNAGAAPPNVSNLNFNAGMNIPNLVITQIGDDGKINIFNAFGATHVLIDVLGYGD